MFANDKFTNNVLYLSLVFYSITIPGKLLLDLIYFVQYKHTVNISLVSAFLTIPIFFVLLLKKRLNIYDQIIMLFFMLTIVSIACGIISFESTIPNELIVNYIASSLILSVIYYFLGCIYQAELNLIPVITSFSLLIVIIYIGFYQFVLSKSLWAILNENGSYLRTSDLFAINSFICIYSIKRNMFYRFAISVISCGALLFLGSRSSTGIYIIAIVVTEIIYFDLDVKKRLLALIGLLIAWLNYDSIYDNINNVILKYTLTDVRILSTLLESGDYGGISSRKELLKNGLNRIGEHPFLGKFMGDVAESGVSGKYIHNILFLWDEFGFIPFVCIIVAIILSTADIFSKKSDDNFKKEIVAIFIFSVISMTFSRSFQFPYLFLVLGYFSGTFKNEYKI